MLIVFDSDHRMAGSIRLKEIDESFRCTFCNCLRWDLSIDTENCTVDSEWKLLVFCVHTYALAQRTVRVVLCGNGTRIQRNRSAPRKHVNCRSIGGVNRVSFHRFYRPKSRFLSKMIKYGAYEINVELNSWITFCVFYSSTVLCSANFYIYLYLHAYIMHWTYIRTFYYRTNNSIDICARKFFYFSNKLIFFKILYLLSKPLLIYFVLKIN